VVTPWELKAWRIAHMARQKEIAAKDAALAAEREKQARHQANVDRWKAGCSVVEANALHGAPLIYPGYPGAFPWW
jgi:hypothetical protein